MLLPAAERGERAALDRLMPLAYDELHRLAAAHMRREKSGHTPSPTALVAEAYLRLSGGEAPAFENRGQFFAIASRQMRRVLVDHARRRTADKRGGGARRVTFDEAVASGDRPEALEALEALDEALEALDERKVRIVELAYFGGLSQQDIGVALGVHENTVARELRLARAWLGRQMRGEG